MALEWIRVNRGYARTVCQGYEMSIATSGGAPLYTAFARTAEPMNPIFNLGARRTADEAKALCEAHKNNKSEGAHR